MSVAKRVKDLTSGLAGRIIPLLDRVLVARTKAPSKTESGILLPDSVQKGLNEAVVVAIGPGRKSKNGELQQLCVKTGDRVLLPEFGGVRLKLEGEEYLLFRDEEILAQLKE